MIDTKLAYKKLLQAIMSIENDYVIVKYNDTVPDYELQPERSFAYELYSRWSSLLDQHPETPISNRILRLNGEITKHFKDEKGILSPDIVLHGGQNDTQHQLIACEIKRKLDSSNKKEVLKDIIKLYHYLNLKRYVIDGDDEDAKYQMAVFIALNTSIEDMKHYIYKRFEEFSTIEIDSKYLDNMSKEELKKAIISHAKNIRCISVEPSSGDENAKPIIKISSLNNCINISHE